MDQTRDSMDAATAQMLARLKRLMPPPAPEGGWGFAFLQAVAWALSSRAQSRHTLAESNLVLGQKMARSDAGNWSSDPFSWTFDPIMEPAGATTFYLDTWGLALGVPRNSGELDGHYRGRILQENLSGGQTNRGLASIIESSLEISGVAVVDAGAWFVAYRYNDGVRMNSGFRFAPFGGDDVNCCFTVILPCDIPEGHSEQELYDLANRQRAAGTRIIAIMSDGSQLAVSAPGSVSVAKPYQAHITYGEPGVTYAWTVENGVIISGQGTPLVTVRPISTGNVVLRAAQTTGVGIGKTGHRTTIAIDMAGEVIYLDATEVPAGESIHAAWVDAQIGATYAWSIGNAYLLSGAGTNRITFALGEADRVNGATANLTCATNIGTGNPSIATAQVQILPFPHTYIYTTNILAPGGTESFGLNLGKKWLIDAIATTAPARVRVYASSTQRDADGGRQATPDPAGVQGLLAECITTSDNLSITMRPWAYGETPLNLAYLAIDNLSKTPASIVLTLTTQKNEA